MSFKVGQTVKWTSQACGNVKHKQGTVEQVIPAGQKPSRSFRNLYSRGNGLDGVQPRKAESYVVVVDGRAYWPRANQLSLADTEFVQDIPEKDDSDESDEDNDEYYND
jgi:hypothetical protein